MFDKDKVAIELESFVGVANPVSGRIEPWDLYSHLEEVNENLDPEVGEISVDIGKGQRENVCAKPRPVAEAVEAQQHMLDHIRGSAVVPRDVRHFFGLEAPWINRVVIRDEIDWEWCNYKPRYVKLREAVRQESMHGALIDLMAVRASSHFNIPLDPCSWEGLLVLSVVNNAAPYTVDGLGARYGIDVRKYWGLWSRFADPNRFPRHGDWFGNARELVRHQASLPPLLDRIDKENDVWEVDLDPKSRSGFHKPWSLGCKWKPAREKINEDTGERYVELRIGPSLDPYDPRFLDYTQDVMNLVVEIGDLSGRRRGGYASPEDAADVFRQLHRRFPDLVPPRPLTEQERLASPSMILPEQYQQRFTAAA